MAVFPDLGVRFSSKKLSTVPVYSDDSEIEENPWTYKHKSDSNNIPVSIL